MSKKLTNEEFIRRAKEKHGDKYDYSKTDVNNRDEKGRIIITCPIHGDFKQTPDNHLHGKKCKYCSHRSFKYKTEEWVEIAKLKHKDKYDYSKVEYVNAKTRICIICPIHGEFMQFPKHHLKGCGCDACNNSLLEKQIKELLDNNNINFKQQKRFDWLGKQSLDFYLPKYNIAIECQGIQHFKEIDFFGGKEGYKYTIDSDIRKKKLLEEHNINVLYFSNLKEYDTFLGETLIKDEKDVLDKIYSFLT